MADYERRTLTHIALTEHRDRQHDQATPRQDAKVLTPDGVPRTVDPIPAVDRTRF